MTGKSLPLPQRLIPTAQMPLLGLTILLVEDSRVASEALRRMCLHSGARLRRADCIRSARRHLASYFPSVSIVDMGLPDGSGADLIADLASKNGKIAPVIAISGDYDSETKARASGAHAFLTKPIGGIALFEKTILDLLPETARPSGPRPIRTDPPAIHPAAFRDDLAHADRLLRSKPTDELAKYTANFVLGVARCANDLPLQKAATIAAEDSSPTNLAALQGQLLARLDATNTEPV